jgi:branched-chain amino acid transport system permease protein
MSASQWRKAMNTSADRWNVTPAAVTAEASAGRLGDGRPDYSDQAAPAWLKWIWQRVSTRHVLVLAAVLLYPWVASSFFTYQIGAQSLMLGLIALSLTFLGGYGGMVTLSQMTVAGVAAYMLGIFGSSSSANISLNWPWWLAALMAIGIGTLFATLVGWLSVRTEGIYTIMITLAIGVAFFYLAQQNYTLFNGFQGLSEINPPILFGVDWRSPMAFYYLTLVCSLAGYFWVKYLIRAPFGLALQGVRDNARRMNALGFNVTAHRVAAHAFAGVLASVGGVLMVWYAHLISPGSIGTGAMINILIIAVLGGMKHPIGAFIGAVIFVLLQNFAVDLFSRERFNLVIGGVFLAVVLFSPDGMLGLWSKLRNRFGKSAQDKL